MSIKSIGLNFAIHSRVTNESVVASNSRPRDYVNKNLAVAKARRDYFSESVRLSKIAVNKRIEMESETTATINRLNKNGQTSPEPNLSYHKPAKRGSAYAAMAGVARRFDMTI